MIPVSSTGGLDDTATIQTAIDAAYAAGGGALTFPDDKYRISAPLVPRSYVHLDFAGAELLCENGVGIHQQPGSQLFGASVRNLIARSDGNGTLLSLTAAQCCEFSNIMADDFDQTIKIESAAVTTFDEARWPLTSHNTIFNTFSHITAYNCRIGLSVKGHLDVNGVPDMVVTQNRFEHLTFFHVREKGIDLIAATDTENFDRVLISLSEDGAVGLDIASNPIAGNDYCNSHRFSGVVFSRQPNVATGTLIRMGWTFGTIIDAEHDLGPQTGIVELDGLANSQSHSIRIKATNGASNLVLETHEKNVLHNVDGNHEIRHNGKTRFLSCEPVVCLGGGTEDAAFRALPVAGARNFLQAVPTVPGQGKATLQAIPGQGGDQNIDLELKPFGTGKIRLGTVTPSANAPSTGYMLVKDANGTLVKLMTRA